MWLFHFEAKGGVAEPIGVTDEPEVFTEYSGFLPASPQRRRAVAVRVHTASRGLELTAPGDELVVLPTYTAMLALRKIAAARGLVRPYWEQAA